MSFAKFKCVFLTLVLLHAIGFASCNANGASGEQSESGDQTGSGSDADGGKQDGNPSNGKDGGVPAVWQNISSFDVCPEKEVTYLVYMAADNDLEPDAIKNLKSLQKVGSSSNANILVLLDRHSGYDAAEEDRKGADLYYITCNPGMMNDDIISEMGELNMADSVNLQCFLEFACAHYPAKHMILNIWSHGFGVHSDGLIPKSVIRDDNTNNSGASSMRIIDMAKAIRNFENRKGCHLDLMQFDCCDMQMIEVAFQLRDLADYVAAPLTEILANGSDYEAIAGYLKNGYSKEEFPGFLVESFYNRQKNNIINIVYSYVETSRFSEFTPVFDAFCESLIGFAKTDFTHLKRIRDSIVLLDDTIPEAVDLMCFANNMSGDIDIAALAASFSELVPAVKATDIDGNVFSGLGINFPCNAGQYGKYKAESGDFLDFYLETKWADFMREYMGNM
ncbi:MAG TPA: hypothetical protein DCO86_03425 [Spirochaetaceae bacterium]|nr:hypothetical protein [Spirochaetaceae bacterium]